MDSVKRVLYVICSSRETGRDRQNRQALYSDLEIRAVFPVRSAVQFIRERAAGEAAPFLVCREDVWLGAGISAHVDALIEELDARFQNWALCGNQGVRWDGRHVYDYTFDLERLGLETALCPHPVIALDDNLLLVNPPVFTKHTRLCPAVASLRSGTLLSLECLKNESLLAVSPRLMSVRGAGDNSERELPDQAEFREYYRSSFVNGELHTADGPLDLREVVDYRYVSEPGTEVAQEDILDLYDRSLARARSSRRPSLTIACRTQFARRELLDRACLSFSACRQYATDLVDLRIVLVTDQSPAVAEPELATLRSAYPLAAIECLYHQIRPNRHSRADLLMAMIEQAQTDYVWFVDDDDYVISPAMSALARCLVTDSAVMVISSALVADEKWSESEKPAGSERGERELIESGKFSRYYAARVFQSLRGRNHIPICSMILPVALLRDRIAHKLVLGDFNEDYYILLLALTAPRVEVSVLDTDLAVVSIRGSENTVTQTDRSGWYHAYATFMLEILNNQEANSPFLWQQTNSLI